MTLTPLGAIACPPLAAVTSVAAVVRAEDGRLVLADLGHGPDLPGGPVDRADRTALDAARRTVLADTGVRLARAHLLEVVRSDVFGPDDPTYLVVLRADAVPAGPAGPTDPADPADPAVRSGSVLLAPDDFLDRYAGGRPALMRHLVRAAQRAWAAPAGG